MTYVSVMVCVEDTVYFDDRASGISGRSSKSSLVGAYTGRGVPGGMATVCRDVAVRLRMTWLDGTRDAEMISFDMSLRKDYARETAGGLAS